MIFFRLSSTSKFEYNTKDFIDNKLLSFEKDVTILYNAVKEKLMDYLEILIRKSVKNIVTTQVIFGNRQMLLYFFALKKAVEYSMDNHLPNL